MYAENRYANIENELLVVVFGAERFQTLYEKHFRVKGPQTFGDYPTKKLDSHTAKNVIAYVYYGYLSRKVSFWLFKIFEIHTQLTKTRSQNVSRTLV